jgi:preprotein translocase subunit YajC
MILAQAAAANNWQFPLLMIGMFAVMYFFMIRPQQKKAKDQQKMVSELSNDGDTITISAGGGARLTFEKTSISRKK